MIRIWYPQTKVNKEKNLLCLWKIEIDTSDWALPISLGVYKDCASMCKIYHFRFLCFEIAYRKFMDGNRF